MTRAFVVALLFVLALGANVEAAVYDVATFNSGTGTGDVSFNHSLGVRPKGAIFYWSIAGTTPTSAAQAIMGVGLTDGTTSRAYSATSADAAATSDCNGRWGAAGSCIQFATTTGASQGEASLGSWTASQVTVNFSVAPSSDRVVGVWLVGGDDVQVSVVGWTTPGGAGTSNVTGFGFNPAAGDLFVTLAGNGAALGGQATQAQWSFGVADGTDQWVTGWRSEDAAAAANTARYLSTTDCLGRVASSADTWSGAAFTGYTSAGVSVNFAGAITLVAASMVVRVVGRPIDVSTFGYTSGSTTDVSTLTCPGSYLIAGHSSSTTGSVVTAASATFGLGENTTDVAVGIRDADTADPTEARRGFDATATVANPNNLSGYNHVGVANPTPTGFTVTWSTEPSAAMTFGFVAFPSNARLAATHSTAASRSATGARGAASRTALSTCH